MLRKDRGKAKLKKKKKKGLNYGNACLGQNSSP